MPRTGRLYSRSAFWALCLISLPLTLGATCNPGSPGSGNELEESGLGGLVFPHSDYTGRSFEAQENFPRNTAGAQTIYASAYSPAFVELRNTILSKCRGEMFRRINYGANPTAPRVYRDIEGLLPASGLGFEDLYYGTEGKSCTGDSDCGEVGASCTGGVCLGDPSPACGVLGTLKAYQALCMGYQFLELAESSQPVEIVSYGNNGIDPEQPFDAQAAAIKAENRLWRLERVGAPISQDDELNQDWERVVHYTLPVQEPSGAATLAEQAYSHFRDAALWGARVLDNDECPFDEDGGVTFDFDTSEIGCTVGAPKCHPFNHLQQRVRTADALGNILSEEHTLEPLATAVPSMIGESMLMLEDTMTVVRENVYAEAHAKFAEAGNKDEAVRFSWRSPVGSRLEVVNFLVGVKPQLFQAQDVTLPMPAAAMINGIRDEDNDGLLDNLIATSDDPLAVIPASAFADTLRGDYPTVDVSIESPEDQKALRIVRQLGIDPRIAGAPPGDEDDWMGDNPTEADSWRIDYLRRVRLALVHSFPETFGPICELSDSQGGSTESERDDAFFRTLDLKPDALIRAARRLRKELYAFGIPLKHDVARGGCVDPADTAPMRCRTTDPQFCMDPDDPTTFEDRRVLGTVLPGPVSPAYFFALSAGGSRPAPGLHRLSNQGSDYLRSDRAPESWYPQRNDTTIGTLNASNNELETNIPRIGEVVRGYAGQGLFQLRDSVATVLQQTIRDANDSTGQGRGDVDDPEQQALLETVYLTLREYVPMRARLCVGEEVPGQANDVAEAQFRIYGPEEELIDHTWRLVKGEEGLLCVLNEDTTDEDCSPYVFASVSATPVDLVAQAGDEFPWLGLNAFWAADKHLEVDRYYVVRTHDVLDLRSDVVTSLSIEPGYWLDREGNQILLDDQNTGSTYTRCDWYPVGTPVIHSVAEAIEPGRLDPGKPRALCGGIDQDIKLPLEDELTETTTGEDEVESSFRYFLDLAKQAAAEADMLGDQLVASGLEMDIRAEIARDELERICGGVINVPDFTVAAPTPCSPMDPCSTGSCVAGMCRPRNMAEFFPKDSNQQDDAALERCFGPPPDAQVSANPGPGDLVVASLGSRPLCVYQRPGAPVCHDAAGLPDEACPAIVPEIEDCTLANAGAIFAGVSLPGGSSVFATQTMGLVPEMEDNDKPVNCGDLARYRMTGYLPDGARGPMQEWMTAEIVRGIAQDMELILEPAPPVPRSQPWGLGIDPVTIKKGGKVLLSTGGMHANFSTGGFPFTASQKPFMDDITCTGPNQSIYCGLGTNSEFSGGRLRFAMGLLYELAGLQQPDVTVRQYFYRNDTIGSPKVGLINGLGFFRVPEGVQRGDVVFADKVWQTFQHSFALPGNCAFGAPCNPLYTSYYNNSGGMVTRENAVIERYKLSLEEPEGEGDQWYAVYENPNQLPGYGTGHCPPYESRETVPDSRTDNATQGFEGETTREPVVEAFCHTNFGYIQNARDNREPGVWPDERWVAGGDSFLDFNYFSCNHPRHGSPGDVTDLPEGLYANCKPIFMNHFQHPRDFETSHQQAWKPDRGNGRKGCVEFNLTNRTTEALNGNVALDCAHDYENAAPRNRYGGYNHVNLWDAVELACMAYEESGTGCGLSFDADPNQNVDFDLLASQMDCVADQVKATAQRLYFQGLPHWIVEDISSSSSSSNNQTYRGELGITVQKVRAGLENITGAIDQIGSTVRDFSAELRLTQSRIDSLDLQEEINAKNALRETLNLANECAVATFNAIPSVSVSFFPPGGSASFSPGAMLAANATCDNSSTQQALVAEINGLENQQLNEDRFQAMQEMMLMMGTRMDALSEASRTLSTAYYDTVALLLEIENKQANAKKQFAKLAFLDRDDVGREYNVNRVMRSRQNTLKIRYDEARRNAIKMAWIARRSIEQRLGMNLSEMRTDMTLVGAPKTWADTICSQKGIDYSEVRDVDSELDNYAHAYIGDYVDKLEQLVESYRFDYPFQDGEDVAIMSMRDEILYSRVPCDEEGNNLLTWSVDPSIESRDPEDWEESGWWGTVDSAFPRVMTVNPAGEGPFSLARQDGSGRPGRRKNGLARAVKLEASCSQREPTGLDDTYCGGANNAGRPADVQWQQSVPLEPGEYMISWYERLDDVDLGADCYDDQLMVALPAPKLTARIYDEEGVELTDAADPMDNDDSAYLGVGDAAAPTADPYLDVCNWRRVMRTFTVPQGNRPDNLVTVGFELTDDIILGNPGDPGIRPVPSAVFAAPHLERLLPDGGPAGTRQMLPTTAFPTDDDHWFLVGRCIDSDGEYFSTPLNWSYGCETLCNDGLGQYCSAARGLTNGATRCFYETRFNLSLLDIENGRLGQAGGFAVGNFNYRSKKIAVNLVGTALRDCGETDSPATCQASAFIPYSLRHERPYRIRNYDGKIVDSNIFTGNIEHAKALMAERYITNPVSTADRSLLQDYYRKEFAGRPLEGNYVLRVWETPGFDFSQVEDVQLILNYDYWTRFE